MTKVGLDHFWVAADVAWLARGDDPALHEGKHTVAHLKDHVDIVLDQENTNIPFGRYLANQGTELGPLFRVEPGSRLVQQDKRRIGGESPRNGRQPALSVIEAARRHPEEWL
jgi:hypothetical protein